MPPASGFRSLAVSGGGPALHLADWDGPEAGVGLLLVHGLAGSCRWWDLAAPRLAERARTVALDLRGHGDSGWGEPPYSLADYAADIERARLRLGWERFALAAHSMGARAALEYARLRPERLSHLALLDFMPHVIEEDPGRFRLAGRVRQPRYPSLESMVRRFHLQPPGHSAAPGVLEALAPHCCRQEPDGLWTWKFDWRALALDYTPAWPFLGELRAPCLVLRGEHSTVMPREIFKRVVSAIPRAVGAELPGAHHHLMLDRPADTAEALLSFLG